MTGISTHVLDTSLGRPAEGVPVELALRTGDGWRVLGTAVTDPGGRAGDLPAVEAGSVVRLLFDTGAYHARTSGEAPFFPEVAIVLTVAPGQHHHVPLLLSPFGYSVYRGSR